MKDPHQQRILTMNRGSSTLKAALYNAGDGIDLLLSISVDLGGASGAHLRITDAQGKALLDSSLDRGDSAAALEIVFRWLDEHDFLSGLAAAGHRLVHGGALFSEPARITPEFLSEIEQLVPLDPDHLPAAIEGIRFFAAKFPDIPQVACFDTAFHKTLPQVARIYALPRRFYRQGIVRYGFHGLSYEYIMSELRALEGPLANGRVIIAHLGSGASIAAVKNGKSVDTSMGFTPLEGLVMGTRCGDVDPGALLFLLGQNKMSPKELDRALNKESGLLGLSGTSADVRQLINNMAHDPRAAGALDLFCYRVKKYIGAYAAALGGVDVLVFAGGIGEHAPIVREHICEGLDFLGIRLDAARNESGDALISTSDSLVHVRVIKTDEDIMIARHVVSTLAWATL